MISDYPEYNKKLVFETSEKKIDLLLDFITMVRNRKQELNIGSEFRDLHFAVVIYESKN